MAAHASPSASASASAPDATPGSATATAAVSGTVTVTGAVADVGNGIDAMTRSYVDSDGMLQSLPPLDSGAYWIRRGTGPAVGSVPGTSARYQGEALQLPTTTTHWLHKTATLTRHSACRSGINVI